MIIVSLQVTAPLHKYSDDEPRDDHGRWTAGGDTEPQPSDRVTRALTTHKPSTKEKQDLATAAEQKVASMLGAKSTGNNLPVDNTIRSGGRLHGVEVKSISDNGNNKITMHPESLARKHEWAKKNSAVLHTVVVDVRKNTVYYRRGVGSFRLHTLTVVESAAHLRRLVKA